MKLLTRRIPSILGLVVLIAGLAGGVFLVRQNQQLAPRAAASLAPQNVTVSNITDRSFTVTWTTSAPASAGLSLSRSGQSPDLFGDQINNAVTHSVVVDNLRPGVQYEFRLESGGNLFDQQGKNFTVVTGPLLADRPPASDIAQGVVKTAAGDPAAGVIVYAQLPSGQLLSTVTTDSGNWLLPLSVSRAADLSAWLNYDLSSAVYTIFAQAGDRGSAEVVITTGIDQPAPPIVLGQNADFRSQTSAAPLPADLPADLPAEASAKAGASQSPFSLFNFDSLGPVTPVAAEVTLLNPGQEGEEISTSKPEFFGKGPAGTEVNITVESPQTVTGNAVVDDSGRWKFSVPADLDPGSHTVTLQWTDADGVLQTLKRSFVVQAAETPAFTASPSAVPTKKFSPSPTPVPPVKKTVPATTSGTPKSGSLTPLVILSMMGILLIGGGGLLLKSEIINQKS